MQIVWIGIDPPSHLIRLDRNLAISYDFCAILIKSPLSHNLVSTNLRKNLGPKGPVNSSQYQNTHSYNREHVVRIAVGIPTTLGWDKRNEGEEDVREKVEDRYGKVSVPW